MLVKLRIEAQFDILEGTRFYEVQHQGLGEYFKQSVRSELDSLNRSAGIHESLGFCFRKLVRKFPFAIFYILENDMVDVFAILDCRQDPETIAGRIRDVSE